MDTERHRRTEETSESVHCEHAALRTGNKQCVLQCVDGSLRTLRDVREQHAKKSNEIFGNDPALMLNVNAHKSGDVDTRDMEKKKWTKDVGVAE